MGLFNKCQDPAVACRHRTQQGFLRPAGLRTEGLPALQNRAKLAELWPEIAVISQL